MTSAYLIKAVVLCMKFNYSRVSLCFAKKHELTKLTSVFSWLLNVSVAQYQEIEFVYQNILMLCILSKVFIILSQLILFFTNFQNITLLVKHPVNDKSFNATRYPMGAVLHLITTGARFTKRINSRYGVRYPGNGVNNSKLEATPFHKTGGWPTKRM